MAADAAPAADDAPAAAAAPAADDASATAADDAAAAAAAPAADDASTPPAGPVASWTPADVFRWFAAENVQVNRAAIIENVVDGPLLLGVDDEELQELGMKRKLQRRRILLEVSKLKKTGAAAMDGGVSATSEEAQSGGGAPARCP